MTDEKGDDWGIGDRINLQSVICSLQSEIPFLPSPSIHSSLNPFFPAVHNLKTDSSNSRRFNMFQ